MLSAVRPELLAFQLHATTLPSSSSRGRKLHISYHFLLQEAGKRITRSYHVISHIWNVPYSIYWYSTRGRPRKNTPSGLVSSVHVPLEPFGGAPAPIIRFERLLAKTHAVRPSSFGFRTGHLTVWKHGEHHAMPLCDF